MTIDGGSNGAANGGGYCDVRTSPPCDEMDVWEANKYATGKCAVSLPLSLQDAIKLTNNLYSLHNTSL